MSETALRFARSSNTWGNGDRTNHLWVEVEPDGWLEVNRLPETAEEAAEFRARNSMETMIPGKTYAIRVATRYLAKFSDSFELLPPASQS